MSGGVRFGRSPAKRRDASAPWQRDQARERLAAVRTCLDATEAYLAAGQYAAALRTAEDAMATLVRLRARCALLAHDPE